MILLDLHIFLSECIHGGSLKNAYLEDFKNTNHTRIENVDSMDECVDKCCKVKDCDIALLDSRKCYAVNCAHEDACRVRHTTDALSDEESELTFILKKSLPPGMTNTMLYFTIQILTEKVPLESLSNRFSFF